jgi:hypothetical protein
VKQDFDKWMLREQRKTWILRLVVYALCRCWLISLARNSLADSDYLRRFSFKNMKKRSTMTANFRILRRRLPHEVKSENQNAIYGLTEGGV